MVSVMMIGLIIFTQPFIADSTPTDKDSETNKTASKGCYYKGRYHNGNWEDGCDHLCTCLNPDTGYYKCRRRCPRYAALPSNCMLVLPPGSKCCKHPTCFTNTNGPTRWQETRQSSDQTGIPDIFKNPKTQDNINGSIKNYKYARDSSTRISGVFSSDNIKSGEAIHHLEGLTSVNIHENNQNNRVGPNDRYKLFNQSAINLTPQNPPQDISAKERLLPRHYKGVFHQKPFNQDSGKINITVIQDYVTTTEVHGSPNSETSLDNSESNSNNSDSDSSQSDTKDTSNPESTANDTVQHRSSDTTATTPSNIDSETRNVPSDKNSSTSDSDVTVNSGDKYETPISTKVNETSYPESTSSNANSGKDDDNDKTTGIRKERLINYILTNRQKFREAQLKKRYLIPPLSNTRNYVAKTRNSMDVTRHDVAITRNNMDVGRNDVSRTRNNVDITNNDVATIRTIVDITNNDVARTRNSVDITRNAVAITSNTIDVRRNDVARTRNNVDITNNDIARVRNNVARTRNNVVRTRNNVARSFNDKRHVYQKIRQKSLSPIDLLKEPRMQKTTAPENKNLATDKNTTSTSFTTSPSFVPQTVTYKPIVPVYTGANISLKYKDKEWGKFVKEISEMFLEVNRMKKSNQNINTKHGRQPNQHDLFEKTQPIVSSESVKPKVKSRVNARVISRDRFYGNQQTTSPLPRDILQRTFQFKRKSLQTSNSTDCVYQGRRYRPGDTWVTKCNQTCICYKGFDGRYMCEKQRCLTPTEVPHGCMVRTQSSGCCGELHCPGNMNKTSNPKVRPRLDAITADLSEQQTNVKYVRTPTGIIRLTQTGDGKQKWVGTFLPNINTNSKGFCLYKNRKYMTGDVWQDGCNSCQCVNGMFARYTCRVRCPSFNHIPKGCILHVVSKQQCCPILKCYDQPETIKKPPTTRTTDWMRVTMATLKNTAKSPFIQTFFVPKVRTTTETPFVKNNVNQDLLRMKNGIGIIENIKHEVGDNLNDGNIRRTKAKFGERWRRKSSSRNTPRGVV